jgi:hypothetical protein
METEDTKDDWGGDCDSPWNKTDKVVTDEVITDKVRVTVNDYIDGDLDGAILNFSLVEVQEVINALQSEDTPTIVEAEKLQLMALRGADILSEIIGKLHKTIHYLDAKTASVKNKASLNFVPPAGVRDSIELRKIAGTASDELLDVEISLSKAKGAKALLEKKYEIIIKSHHYYKDVANGLKLTIQGRYSGSSWSNEE